MLEGFSRLFKGSIRFLFLLSSWNIGERREGTVDIDLWNKVGERLQNYYSAHGPKKVPVDTFGLWTLIRDSLDLRHEGFKIENVKEHALGMDQATKENESNLASPAISPSAPLLEALEGRKPSYHELDSGPGEEMEEEQSPLMEEALVQLCDKEIQTIEIASIGYSKKVYPSPLTATWTVAADPSEIPFEERWNKIQGTVKRLTLTLEVQQKMGQPHPKRLPLATLIQEIRSEARKYFGFEPFIIGVPFTNQQLDWLLRNTDAFPIALADFTGVVDNHYPQVKLLQFAQLQEFVFPRIISSTPIEGVPTIFTDGPSNGAAVYVVHGKVFSHLPTTASAQVVELHAVALVLLHFSSSFNLYSDSKYVVNAVS
ncbi:Endogenous Retrovirus Group K Member 6 Pol Protein [Manis pentadactyla]|nr:Endogenous Retrovirus Group K Member 6 Pol Protein [Manis pentadactyla]